MGYSSGSNLVVGVSMAKLFSKVEEKINTFDEFDRHGDKTGKQFTEEKVLATLPNGKELIIAEGKNKFSSSGWDYNFYDSMGFDDGEYIGDNPIKSSIHYCNSETNNLSQIIIGINVCNSDDSNGVSKIDEAITNSSIDITRKELAELYGYTGNIELYLIHYASY